MSLRRVGPIPLAHGNPSHTFTSTPAFGRDAPIAGVAEWSRVTQLVELVENPDRVVTFHDRSGVLEWVEYDDDLLGPQRGWHLLHSVTLTGDHQSSLGDAESDVPFSLSCTRIGTTSRELVLARSAHMRPNGLSLPATAIVSDPLGRDGRYGDPFAWSPGGNYFTREYEGEAGDPRMLAMYAGLVSPGGDELDPTVHPATDERPDYGADCRGYDRRSGRAVHGPAHPLTRSTDLELRNGLTRWWIGPTAVPAYVTCYAFAGGAWHEKAILSLAEDATLLSARLARVTPTAVTAVLKVRGQGDVSVMLRRGERQVVVHHAGGPNAGRVIGWRGVPPTRYLDGLDNDFGHFGTGLVLEGAS